jgi:hypothetical protein
MRLESDFIKIATKRRGVLLAFATCRTDLLRLGHLCATFNAIPDGTLAGVLHANRLLFYWHEDDQLDLIFKFAG